MFEKLERLITNNFPLKFIKFNLYVVLLLLLIIKFLLGIIIFINLIISLCFEVHLKNLLKHYFRILNQFIYFNYFSKYLHSHF